jgi:hypothetical protein
MLGINDFRDGSKQPGSELWFLLSVNGFRYDLKDVLSNRVWAFGF